VTDDLNNPMRFSIRHRTVDLSEYPVDVTEVDIRPSEGNVYVHWEESADRPKRGDRR